ncbi:alpha/beta fold hydrolase [Zavarzinia compransoris]|nr:alpha/beta hydrolase [Zavarzinia compransoris]TDP49300.1 pimeloyl-ACP methyl ester carboxylesterase [Zavarzinia compransoris]
MPLDHIQAAGATIAVRTQGAGPAILCLHATGQGARDYDRFAERMGDRFTVLALDWPGHGDSPAEAAPASAARYAGILAGAVAALGLSRVIVIGNSIGGAAAISYAAAHPDRVRGLVLCDSGGLAPVNLVARLYCRHMARRFARAAAGDRRFPDWFARYYRTILPAPAADWRRDEIVAGGPAVAGILAQAWESFARPQADLRHLVPALAMPVFYAWGRKDRTLRWSWSKAAALKAPNRRVQLFDAGHAAFLEQPDEFDRAFAGFAGACP